MIYRARKHSRILLLAILGLTLSSWLLTPIAALAASSVEKLQEFPLDQVQVTDEYQKNLFAKDIAYIITMLNVDRLLSGFKAVSQGTNPTNLYGGWESMLIRGHSMGHWMSAVAHAYQQAKGSDTTLAGQIQTKLDYAISQLKSFQLANGFLFATPPDQFDAVEGKSTASQWVPWYTMHKILAGLVEVYKSEGNADALAVASKLGDWVYSRTSSWDSGTRSRVLGVEYGGMNDALYELYKYSNSANHLSAAHAFDETTLFTSIASGNDILNGLHANATIPKFIGALNRYRTVGASESSYLTAADQFWAIVLKDHTYVTGGHGEDEHFHQPGKLAAMRDDVNNETCNSYNMLKLTRELFKINADVKYADYFERTQINEILAAMNPDTGMATYFKAMGTGYFKAFGTPENSFWCDTGTGMEDFTKLGDSLYFHDATDLYVVRYVSSILNWKDRGLTLTQTTDIPLSSRATFAIGTAPTDAVNLKFRKPYWLASCQAAMVTVNGQSFNAVESGGFFGVNRVWQAGDKVELTLPAEVQVSRLPDNANEVAFVYGPLVLSAGLGTASMTTTGHALTIAATKPSSGIQDTITINSSTTINDWLATIKNNLIQTPGALEFNLKNTDSDGKLTFMPYYQRYKDRYGIYFKLAGTAGSSAPDAGVCPAGTGGSTGSGGATASSGGSTGNAGAGGGNKGGGGAAGTGGATAGAGGATGAQGSGGKTAAAGGAQGSGGMASGSGGNGGATAGNGGATGNAAAGGATAGNGGATRSTAAGGATGGTTASAGQRSSGCSCNLGSGSAKHGVMGLLLALGLVANRRIRRRQEPRPS